MLKELSTFNPRPSHILPRKADCRSNWRPATGGPPLQAWTLGKFGFSPRRPPLATPPGDRISEHRRIFMSMHALAKTGHKIDFLKYPNIYTAQS
jgi:hypothetical protein